MAKRKRKTPEERATERAADEELMRQLQAKIEQYRKLIEEKRAS